MKVYKNSYDVYPGGEQLVYDDEVEGGGLRIELLGSDGNFIEISDATDDYGKAHLQIRSSGRNALALLVRPQVANSILVFTEDL